MDGGRSYDILVLVPVCDIHAFNKGQKGMSTASEVVVYRGGGLGGIIPLMVFCVVLNLFMTTLFARNV